jgi:hypothetical protein
MGAFSYKISNRLAMDEAKNGEYVLCLDEVRSNALPQNKNHKIDILYQWNVENNCNGCRKILETNDPKLIRKGIKKLNTI